MLQAGHAPGATWSLQEGGALRTQDSQSGGIKGKGNGYCFICEDCNFLPENPSPMFILIYSLLEMFFFFFFCFPHVFFRGI